MRSLRLTVLLCAAALAGVSFAAAPALASPGETVFFEAPRDLLNVSATSRAATIAKLQTLGVHALRIVLYWGSVAPNAKSTRRPSGNLANPALYHWGAYDDLINAAAALHWTVLLTITGGPAPRWATAGHDGFTTPSAKDFGHFAQAVGRHYGKLVKLYSIWNEPNQPQYLRPQYVKGKLTSPALYRSLFLAGYGGLKSSGNFSGMKVMMGETSPVGVRSAGIPAPLAFLRGTLCLNAAYHPVGHCAKLPAYGYAQHPYSIRKGPFWVPPPADGGADDVTIGTLGRLVTALDRAARAGAIRSGMPIYVTEFGVQSYPNTTLGVSLPQQAEFQAISEKLAWNNPRVVSFDQYLLRDDPPKVHGFSSGLETSGGTAKPSYSGFRLPLVVSRTHAGVSLWGLVRPVGAAQSSGLSAAPRARAAATGGLTAPTTDASGATGSTGASGSTGSTGTAPAAPSKVVQVQYSSNGGHSWRTLLTAHAAASGVWTANAHYARHRLWRVRWISPSRTVDYGAPTRAYTPVSGQIDY